MRLNRIDDWRAIVSINMVVYHLIYDLVFIFGFNYKWFLGSGAYIWEQFIAWSFIFLSGFCQGFAKNSLFDGLKISLCGIIITVVTLIFDLGTPIYFGVLTFIGFSILISIPLKDYLRKLSPKFGMILFFVLFIITKKINKGYLGFASINLVKLPDFLYSDKINWISTFFGLTSYQFASSDYFSFIPWYFLFITGFYFYNYLKRYNKLYIVEGKRIAPFYYISKNSLLIYMVHQPVTLGILYTLYYLNII